MLMLLPLATFVGLFLIFLGRSWEQGESPPDGRQALLQACAVWGGAIGLVTEVLSLFGGLSRVPVAAFWALASLAITLEGGTRRSIVLALTRIRQGWHPSKALDRLFVLVLLSLMGILLVVAYASPPNNTDSLLYHMARVAHWAQNASLKHYPTAFEPQLWSSIWAEEAVLHLRLLWGNDRLSNLVQWFSMVGSIIGVSSIAKLLGADTRAQLVAAAFSFSVPMGILQATSTQNDYVATFWVVSLAYFVVLAETRSLNRIERLSMFLTIGVGTLTKATFSIFGLPFAARYVYNRLRRGGARSATKELGLLLSVTVLFNAGFWVRNTISFGGPLGSERFIAAHTNLADLGPANWVSRLVSNLSLNLATPFDPATDMVEDLVRRFDTWVGVDPGNYELVSLWNHEDVAGNPIHLTLVFASLALLFPNRRRVWAQRAFSYAGGLAAGYVLLAVVVTWEPYGSRFQLPFFVAWGPVIGASSHLLGRPRALLWLPRFLLMAALPWVLFNRTRPVIGIKPWTMTDSIFTISRERILFASWPVWQEPFVASVGEIEEAGCKQVGLRIDSHDLEYALWWLFGAPESGVRIESVYTYPHLEKYIDPTFMPCAILCTICGNRDRLNGLPLEASFGDASVYLGDEFTPEVDG